MIEKSSLTKAEKKKISKEVAEGKKSQKTESHPLGVMTYKKKEKSKLKSSLKSLTQVEA